MQSNQALHQNSLYADQLSIFLQISRRTVIVIAGFALINTVGYIVAALVSLGVLALLCLLALIPMWYAQRLAASGRLAVAVTLSAASFVVMLTVLTLLIQDLLPLLLMGYALTIMSTALCHGAQTSWRVAWLCVVGFLISTLLPFLLQLPTLTLPLWLNNGTLVVLACAQLIILGAIIRQTISRLEQNLNRTIQHEQHLEEQRAALEAENNARTQVMEKTLAALEAQSSDLRRASLELQNREAIIRRFNVPAIPILEGVLVLPLIGNIDSERAELVRQAVFSGIAHYRAAYVLLDITGVPVIDEHGARAIQQATQGARLLGAKLALVGVGPEVAQTIVALNMDLGEINSYASLQQGLEALIGLRGWNRSRAKLQFSVPHPDR